MFEFFRKRTQSALSLVFEKSRPHTLPPVRLSNKFEHFTFRISQFTIDYCFQSVFRLDHYEKPKQGLVMTSSDIFTFRFLKPISKLKISSNRSKIIITDKDSHEMINRVLTTFAQRRHGISCIFEIDDKVSNDFSRNLDVIYLINLTDTSDEDYQKILTNLDQRLAHSCTVFSTYLIDPFDEEEANRLNQLKQILSKRGLEDVLVVGAFNAINPRVASLYNRPSLGYLKKVKKRDSSQSISFKLAFRLLNILEQLNQFPIIRYFKTFHDHNSTIANFCLQGLNALKESRSESVDAKEYSEDYILLIIDRSFDLLTPILHSETYQAFVAQELEIFYDSSIEEVDAVLRNESIFHVAKTLIETSNKFKTNNVKLTEREKNETSQSLKKHTEIVNELLHKLKGGYSALMNVEKAILRSDKSSDSKASAKEKDKMIKELIKENHKNVTSFDLIRLLMIHSTLKSKVEKKTIKSFIKLNKNILAHDVNKIFAFAKLIRSFHKKSSQYYASIEKGPLIRNIIDQLINDSLDEEVYPFAADWMRNLPKDNRKKIILFVRGGLSYNELHMANSFSDYEVILCSDTILTPRVFLSVLLN